MADEVAKRVRNSRDVLGDPHYMSGFSEELMNERLPVREGTHYEVLAYTMWSDYHVPTIVRWTHGALDDFRDRAASLRHRERAREAAATNNRAIRGP